MKKLLLKSMLLLCALIVGSSSVWATKTTIASFSNSNTTGWTINGSPTYSNSGGYQLVASSMSIVSPSIDWSIYTNITISITARTYGGPNDTQKVIYVSQGSTDLTTVSPTSKTLTNYGPIAISPTSGAITISCKNASSNKGSGVSIITIEGELAVTEPGISTSTTSLNFGEVTATGNDNMDGKITISGDDFTDDTEVTLSATVVRKSPALVYDPTSVTITKGESFTAPTFSKDAGINFSSITFSSSYNDVATVSNEGVIALGTSTGTAIIKATFAQTDVYAAGEATCKIIVNPVGVTPEPSATGYYVKVTAVDDLADGDYLIVYEDEQVALDGNLASDKVDGASNTVEYEYDASDNIEVSSDTEAAEFEIKAITGGYSIKSKANSYYLTHTGSGNTLNISDDAVANAITFSEGGNAIIKIGTYNIRYNSASGQKRFRYYTTAANVHLYKKVAGVAPSDIDIYVSEAGYATYASNFDLDFSTNGNLKAYIAKEVSSEIKMVEVKKVAAGTGVLLHATDGGGKAYTVETTTETTADVTGNLFKRGNDEAVAYEAGEGKYNYILNVVNNQLGFYKAAGKTVAKNRAYLQTSIAASRIDMNFDEEVTGIKLVETSKSNNEGYYNLAGQRVAQPTKGLYLVNGRKVIIK